MKIIVTGAAGFIGSHVCEKLIAQGHTVVGIDSFDSYLYPAETKRRNGAHLVETLSRDRFELIEANICDETAMKSALDSETDVLCHLAALAGVRPSLVAPKAYIQTNVEGTVNLLEQCRKKGIDRIVCASSSSVYGAKKQLNDAPEPFRESDPCLQPASPYAATKRAAELLCSTYRDLYGLGITNLRFFTVFGPRQRPDMAIHKFTKAISEELPITLYGDGASQRDYTYIDDIVKGVVASITHASPGQLATYNLGGTVTTSLTELVSCIEEVVGKRANIKWEPEQPGDVPITYADVTLANRELGYAPSVSLLEGLKRFWSWFQTERCSDDRCQSS